jgi:hypothetical protein
MDSRTRWIVGILLALVVGLGVGLVIVAGDDSEDETTVTAQPTEPTRPEATERTETETTETGTSGGTPAPTPDKPGTVGSGL